MNENDESISYRWSLGGRDWPASGLAAQVDVKPRFKTRRNSLPLSAIMSIDRAQRVPRYGLMLIEAGKKLMVIGRAGVGIDNIDVNAATQRGIIVVNAPTGNTISAPRAYHRA